MSDEPAFEGFEDEPKTTLGFGSKDIGRRLVIGDNVYLLMKCEVVSDGRSKKSEDDGELKFKAGSSTTILAELSESDATQVAAQYG